MKLCTRSIWILFLLLGAPQWAYGDGFFEQKARGWHWYESFQPPPESDDLAKETPPSQPKTPTQILEAFKEKVKQNLHRAILDPSFENVKAYQEIQKVLLDRSEGFAKRWLEVLYQTPHLDETIQHPVSQAGRHLYLDQHQKQVQEKLKSLALEFGLMFFFQGDCPYCEHFAPLIKRFSHTYGWSVLAVSLDGKTLDTFPDARKDNGAADTLHVETVPALFAVHPKTGKAIPVSFGMQTLDQLEERFKLLMEQGAFSCAN